MATRFDPGRWTRVALGVVCGLAALLPSTIARAASPVVAGEFASAIQADEGDVPAADAVDEYSGAAGDVCVPCCRPRPSLLIWGHAGYSYYEVPEEFEGGFTYSAGLIL